MVNKVTLFGKVLRDPEIKTFATGGVKSTALVETYDEWKSKTGQILKRSEIHKVTFYGKIAEIVRDDVKEGDFLYIEARLVNLKWQDEDGNERISYEVRCHDMRQLGRV